MASGEPIDTDSVTQTVIPAVQPKPAWRPCALAAAFCLAMGLLPAVASFRTLSLATSLVIFAILVFGVDLVHSTLRHLSLGHVGIWGLAAYGTFVLQVHAGWSFLEAAGVSIGLAIVAAAIMAVVAFRTEGYYFAILTFVIASLIQLAFNNLDSITGGSEGIFLFDKPVLFGVDLRDPGTFYRVSLMIVFLTMALVIGVLRSRFGAKARAIGASEGLSRSLGINTYWTKVGLFTVSAIPAAVAGVLYASFSGAIQPGLFGPAVGISTVLMALLGGSGTLFGPLIGALIYIYTPNVLPLDPTVGTGAVGLILIVVIRISPAGLAPRIGKILVWVRQRTGALQPGWLGGTRS